MKKKKYPEVLKPFLSRLYLNTHFMFTVFVLFKYLSAFLLKTFSLRGGY